MVVVAALIPARMAQPLCLLDFPLEIRRHIYDFVLANSRINYNARSEAAGSSMQRRGDYEWALFGVSKQVRHESIDCFRLTLDIFRPNADPWKIGDNGVPARVGKVGITLWDLYLTPDDYRNILTEFQRWSVAKIILFSTDGVDGKFFNKIQFPNLKSIVIMQPLSPNWCAEPWLQDCYIPAVGEGVMWNPDGSVDFKEIVNGKYDGMLAKLGKEFLGRYTIRNMPSLENRGFRIFLMHLPLTVERGTIGRNADAKSHTGSTFSRVRQTGAALDYDNVSILKQGGWRGTFTSADGTRTSVEEWPCYMSNRRLWAYIDGHTTKPDLRGCGEAKGPAITRSCCC